MPLTSTICALTQRYIPGISMLGKNAKMMTDFMLVRYMGGLPQISLSCVITCKFLRCVRLGMIRAAAAGTTRRRRHSMLLT